MPSILRLVLYKLFCSMMLKIRGRSLYITNLYNIHYFLEPRHEVDYVVHDNPTDYFGLFVSKFLDIKCHLFTIFVGQLRLHYKD